MPSLSPGCHLSRISAEACAPGGSGDSRGSASRSASAGTPTAQPCPLGVRGERQPPPTPRGASNRETAPGSGRERRRRCEDGAAAVSPPYITPGLRTRARGRGRGYAPRRGPPSPRPTQETPAATHARPGPGSASSHSRPESRVFTPRHSRARSGSHTHVCPHGPVAPSRKRALRLVCTHRQLRCRHTRARHTRSHTLPGTPAPGT